MNMGLIIIWIMVQVSEQKNDKLACINGVGDYKMAIFSDDDDVQSNSLEKTGWGKGCGEGRECVVGGGTPRTAEEPLVGCSLLGRMARGRRGFRHKQNKLDPMMLENFLCGARGSTTSKTRHKSRSKTNKKKFLSLGKPNFLSHYSSTPNTDYDSFLRELVNTSHRDDYIDRLVQAVINDEKLVTMPLSKEKSIEKKITHAVSKSNDLFIKKVVNCFSDYFKKESTKHPKVLRLNVKVPIKDRTEDSKDILSRLEKLPQNPEKNKKLDGTSDSDEEFDIPSMEASTLTLPPLNAAVFNRRIDLLKKQLKTLVTLEMSLYKGESITESEETNLGTESPEEVVITEPIGSEAADNFTTVENSHTQSTVASLNSEALLFELKSLLEKNIFKASSNSFNNGVNQTRHAGIALLLDNPYFRTNYNATEKETTSLKENLEEENPQLNPELDKLQKSNINFTLVVNKLKKYNNDDSLIDPTKTSGDLLCSLRGYKNSAEIHNDWQINTPISKFECQKRNINENYPDPDVQEISKYNAKYYDTLRNENDGENMPKFYKPLVRIKMVNTKSISRKMSNTTEPCNEIPTFEHLNKIPLTLKACLSQTTPEDIIFKNIPRGKDLAWISKKKKFPFLKNLFELTSVLPVTNKRNISDLFIYSGPEDFNDWNYEFYSESIPELEEYPTSSKETHPGATTTSSLLGNLKPFKLSSTVNFLKEFDLAGHLGSRYFLDVEKTELDSTPGLENWARNNWPSSTVPFEETIGNLSSSTVTEETLIEESLNSTRSCSPLTKRSTTSNGFYKRRGEKYRCNNFLPVQTVEYSNATVTKITTTENLGTSTVTYQANQSPTSSITPIIDFIQNGVTMQLFFIDRNKTNKYPTVTDSNQEMFEESGLGPPFINKACNNSNCSKEFSAHTVPNETKSENKSENEIIMFTVVVEPINSTSSYETETNVTNNKIILGDRRAQVMPVAQTFFEYPKKIDWHSRFLLNPCYLSPLGRYPYYYRNQPYFSSIAKHKQVFPIMPMTYTSLVPQTHAKPDSYFKVTKPSWKIVVQSGYLPPGLYRSKDLEKMKTSQAWDAVNEIPVPRGISWNSYPSRNEFNAPRKDIGNIIRSKGEENKRRILSKIISTLLELEQEEGGETPRNSNTDNYLVAPNETNAQHKNSEVDKDWRRPNFFYESNEHFFKPDESGRTIRNFIRHLIKIPHRKRYAQPSNAINLKLIKDLNEFLNRGNQKELRGHPIPQVVVPHQPKRLLKYKEIANYENG